ncbi:hypothetical protein T4E_11875 [Trichinella pseudospiralis]|uniref:Uncharacterized protein n=1 Tax=Trichinella pseudospiralis TaxID=6337 RepID=A0A0V0XQH5_TRIPS|nr:hypothetical protein T4E_11875 [Trichinella pseudospiralis]
MNKIEKISTWPVSSVDFRKGLLMNNILNLHHNFAVLFLRSHVTFQQQKHINAIYDVFFVAVALVAQLTSQEDAYDEEQHQDEHNTLHEDVQAQSIQVSTTDVLVGSFGMLVEMILLPSIRQYQRGKQKTLACLLA